MILAKARKACKVCSEVARRRTRGLCTPGAPTAWLCPHHTPRRARAGPGRWPHGPARAGPGRWPRAARVRPGHPPSRGAHASGPRSAAPHHALAVTWLPPPALRRSRPPPPWKPQAAGRVILACARAAAAPARYRTHLARVRGDSVPHPTPESRPPATPEPHPTHRTRVLGARKVGSILGAHMPRTAAFRGGCPAAEAGAWPTHRAAELLQHGRVHALLSPTSRRPPAAVLHPGHECSHAHLGPLVRRWVRLGVGHAVGGRARGRRLWLALRGHAWTEGADGDRRRAVLDPGGPAAARSSPRRGAARRCRKFW